MATYVPNATDPSQPTASQTVESAAAEFRTLKTRVNALETVMNAEDVKDLRVPELTVGPVPPIATRAGKVLGFDAGGNPVAVAVAGTTDPNLRADLAASSGSSLVGFLQAGTGAVARTAQAKMRESVSVKDFGAATGNTDATNKTALQTAITAVDVAGGGQIVVDYDICYGVKTFDRTTWPDFTGTTKPIIIIDYSRGATYSVYPGAYDGMQIRYWSSTPQTSPSLGQHDGNTFWMRSDWSPYFCLSNDMNIAAVGDPSRNALDNRRAYYSTQVEGVSYWQMGQGTNVGIGYTDEEMSNFHIQKFSVAGDTLGDYSPYLVERKTGNISYGGGRNIPNAHHHFEPVFNSPNTYMVMVEDPYRTVVDIVLRTSNGVVEDVELKNDSGDFIIVIPAQGEALRASKTNRYIGIGENAPSYRFDLVESRIDYVERIRNTSIINGSITRWESSSASGSGWNFLNAYSGGTSDLEFQLNGNGTGYCDGSWTGSGADYAEFFEWADGNPENEDRRGFSVSMIGDKIQKANSGDVVIGVISGNPSVVGDSAWNRWSGKYLRDDFNGYIMEPCQVVEWSERVKVSDAVPAVPAQNITRYVKQDDGSFSEVNFPDPGRDEQPERWEVKRHSYMTDAVPAGLVVPNDAEYRSSERRKINPNYKEGSDYTPRNERPEWDCVGLMGKLRVRKGQPVDTRWIKMRDINETVEEWLVR